MCSGSPEAQGGVRASDPAPAGSRHGTRPPEHRFLKASRSRERRRAIAALRTLGLLLTVAACEREERRFREMPPAAAASPAVTLNDQVQPGPVLIDPEIRNPYEYNAYAISEGQQLYTAFNCNDCHSPRGGGGMGPSLIDSLWIYGSEPENIFESVLKGRPNGMPSFRGRISNDQIWRLVAFVRSLNGLTPMDTRPGRTEGMHATTATPQTDANTPMSARIPPEQVP
jgi:cytochrome c oxidase cbb3-type subunit 3